MDPSNISHFRSIVMIKFLESDLGVFKLEEKTFSTWFRVLQILFWWTMLMEFLMKPIMWMTNGQYSLIVWLGLWYSISPFFSFIGNTFWMVSEFLRRYWYIIVWNSIHKFNFGIWYECMFRCYSCHVLEILAVSFVNICA